MESSKIKAFADNNFTLSQTTNFRLFPNVKEFADENLKFDENGRKFSNWVENTVGKAEIARHKQFLLKRLLLQTRKNQGLFGKGLNMAVNNGA